MSPRPGNAPPERDAGVTDVRPPLRRVRSAPGLCCYKARMRRPVALLALAISCVVSGVACTRGGTSGDASEDRFVKASTGTVRDTTTGLIWTAHDHEQNYAWPDAERHCDTLTVDEQ